MNLPTFAIKRPIMVTSVFVLIIFTGLLSYRKIGVDLFPDVSFPVVAITTFYGGAGPQEIEQLVTKPIEKELSTLSGISRIRSTNKEGVSSIIAEFTMDTDVRFAEQQVKDRVSSLRPSLPDDINEPSIRNFDPADQPVLVLSLTAGLDDAALYDLAEEEIRPLLEQVSQVGYVDIIGGRRKEIHVDLIQNKLRTHRISASQVVNRIAATGKNVPAGKIEDSNKETVIRTLGEFDSIPTIENTLVTFYGNEIPVKVKDVAKVSQSLADVSSKNYVNGKPSLSLMVFRQSGANTIEVANNVKKRILDLNERFGAKYENFSLSIDRDGAKPIQANVNDVLETIIIGIFLVVLVVYFFLGNARSTVITSIAIPNSLIGSLIVMYLLGFSINIMTLLAMSLAIGLLIDDAIVVRENIFRHIELGKSPLRASIDGTNEVFNAVLGTTLTILAVFAPIAFLDGMVGQFFKEFGITVCVIILISMADALIMAPMMSTYFAGPLHPERKNIVSRGIGLILNSFDAFQRLLENLYEKSLHFVLRFRKLSLLASFGIAAGVILVLPYVPKTFTPPQDTGEFVINFDLPAGNSINAMDDLTVAADKDIRSLKQVDKTVVTVGGQNGEVNESSIFVKLVNAKSRSENTSEVKAIVRELISEKYKEGNPAIIDGSGGGKSAQPFQVAILGTNLDDIKKVSYDLYARLKENKNLQEVNISYREGKPEFQVKIDKKVADEFGISSTGVGQELRTLIEGSTPAVYRQNGNEYDIRVRLQEGDRNLEKNFKKTFVPNLNGRLIRLSDVADPVKLEGPAAIYRQDRARYVQITADINPEGKGLSVAINEVKKLLDEETVPVPPGIKYSFVGQAENFQELAENVFIAIILSIILIYLVLASLYESFITPLTIMTVIPLAACGAIYGLAIAGSTLDIFSAIGCILLIGVATKNSIILIDYIEQLKSEGMSNKDAIIKACVVRLRLILMTAFSLIAGMIPLAVGLNEASSQRTSMGVAVIGGTVTSTFLTLFVIPAVYTYMKSFGAWITGVLFKVLTKPDFNELHAGEE